MSQNKIFIDCGAHCGCSVRRFYDMYPDAHKFKIYSFEPNPLLHEYWPVNDVEIIPKAVWVNDDQQHFWVLDKTGGSTLNERKHQNNHEKNIIHKRGWKEEKLQVDCIDISQWMIDTFNTDDFIVFKFDIECAEYEVLPKMFEDGSISYINELYGEFHDNRCGRRDFETQTLIKQINQYGLHFNVWDAIGAKYCKVS